MNILRSATGKRWLGVNCSHGREARSAKRFVLTQCYENRVLSILNECLYQGQLTNDPSSCAGYFMCVHDKLQPFTCQDGTHWDDSQKVAPQLPLLFLDYPSNCLLKNQSKVCNHPEFVGCSGDGSAPASGPSSPTSR